MPDDDAMRRSMVQQMVDRGMSRTDAFVLYDMTRQAAAEASAKIREVAERAPVNLRAHIAIGAVASMAAMVAEMAPEAIRTAAEGFPDGARVASWGSPKPCPTN